MKAETLKITIGLAWILASLLAAMDTTAAPVTARVHLCDTSTLFLNLADQDRAKGGVGWQDLCPATCTVEVREAQRLGEVMVIDERPASVVATCTGRRFEDEDQILGCELKYPLAAGQDYAAFVMAPEEASHNATAKKVAVAPFSTKAKAEIRPEDDSADKIAVWSRTPLKPPPPKMEVVEVVRAPGVAPAAGKNGIEEVLGKVRLHPAKTDWPPHGRCVLPETTEKAPGGYGAASGFWLNLLDGHRLRRHSHGLRLEGLRDVFDQEVVAEGKIPEDTVPKKPGDSQVYVRGLFESGEGEDDSFVLDLKAERGFFKLEDGWMFRPEVAASISRNVPKATNSIRVAPLFSQTKLWDDEKGPGWLIGRTISVGPAFEADRDFDRINGVVELRWKPELHGLYKPRKERRAHVVENITDYLQGDPKELPVYLPDWGWGLEGFAGIEAGGSLREQTVKGADGNPDLEIPDYDIARLRVEATGFVEFRRFKLSVASGLRYLTTEELASRKSEEGELSLREIEDARSYTEATLSVRLDPTGHVSLALTYKNGSLPPVYTRVDKYSAGFVVKY